MSEDIYAKPDLTKKVRFQTGEKEDRNADVDEDINNVTIYDNYCPEETTPPKSEDINTTDNQQQTSSVSVRPGKNPLKAAAVFVGLLCLVLLAAVIVLLVLLIQNKTNWNMERNRLWVDNDKLASERDELQTSNSEMKRFNHNLILKTYQLESEIDLLNATNNNLTSERDDLKLKTSQLEEEKNLLNATNNNLTSERDDLKLKTSQLEKEKNLLNATNKNVTSERDELKKQIEKTRCLDNWIKFDNSCYLISTVKKSWTESRQTCEGYNAQLVIISSIMEQTFIGSLDPFDSAWIGLSDMESKNHWKWVDGTEATTTYWISEQPDNKGPGGQSENCVQFNAQENLPLQTWNDAICSYSYYFICEKILQ